MVNVTRLGCLGWRARLCEACGAAASIAAALVVALACSCGGDNNPGGADASAVPDTGADGTIADGTASTGVDGVGEDGAGDAEDAVADAAADAVADAGPLACKSDKDCLAADQVCAKDLGLCVACNEDADCSGASGGVVTCKAHTCVGPAAKCASSKDCAALGQLCDKAAGQCVDCLSADDCATGQGCVDTVCAKLVCTPAATACADAATLQVCAATGMGWTQTACPSGQHCSDGACVLAGQICTPGAKVCQPGGVATCKGDGSGYGAAEVCPSGKGCVGGACVSADCVPGSSACAAGGKLLACVDGAWQEQACPASQLCVTKGGSPTCALAACVPGTLVCVGAKVAECSSAGEATDITDDCAAKGQTCAQGACQQGPKVCQPSATQCAGAELQTCKADGSGWTSAACGGGETCKDGACAAAPVCMAGVATCAGANVKTCKADGSGWLTTPCPAGQQCAGGSCVGAGCVAGAKSCIDAVTVGVCDANGKLVPNPCAVGSACSDGVCAKTLCTPNEQQCVDAKTEKVCAADGKSWSQGTCSSDNPCATVACAAGVGCQESPLADGASCGSDKVCQAGVCVAQSGCALCGPAEQCVSGACQPCGKADKPVYDGYVTVHPSPTDGSLTWQQLVWSPKHKEWWLMSRVPPSKAVAERYTATWQPVGTTFEPPADFRAVAVLPEGDYVVSTEVSGGASAHPLKRLQGLSGNVVWSASEGFAKVVTSLGYLDGKLVGVAGGYQVDTLRFLFIDPANGKITQTIQKPGFFLSGGFGFGDSLYVGGSGVVTRWLLTPALAQVGPITPMVVPTEVRLLAFDGRRVCAGIHTWKNRLHCYDFYPSCPKPTPPVAPFAGSQLMTAAEQQLLATKLGVGGKVWKRCTASAAASEMGTFFDNCTGGPTVLVLARWGSSGGSATLAAAYAAVGWDKAIGTKQDPAARLVSITSGAVAVPSSGAAGVSTKAAMGPFIEGGLSCTSAGQCTLSLGQFACDDGKPAKECLANFGGVAYSQDAREAFVAVPAP